MDGLRPDAREKFKGRGCVAVLHAVTRVLALTRLLLPSRFGLGLVLPVLRSLGFLLTTQCLTRATLEMHAYLGTPA